MKLLLIVPNPKKVPFKIAGVETVAARTYLTEAVFAKMTGVRVFNLCSSYRYKSIGYYASLIAEARGHRPVPNITAIRDLQTPAMLRMANAELHELLQKNLRKIKQPHYTLSIYFGRNMAKQYDVLCRELFDRFHVPLMRVELVVGRDGLWTIQQLRNIGIADIPENHLDFIATRGKTYFSQHGYRHRRKLPYHYSLAILHDPEEEHAPSNMGALKRFIKAGEKIHLEVKLITRDDFSRLPEFDALFLRETTNVNDHTFRFARYAEANQLAVIDDPQSIIRCANKVYLAEMLAHHKIKTPRTMIVHRDNVNLIPFELGLPCVLKQPDSAFSVGVIKVANDEELHQACEKMLDRSELIIAQTFLPTNFDWRIGILDQQPLFVCRYYMVENHWQIIKHERDGHQEEGNFETVPIDEAPPEAIRVALKACHYIGDGLYGVDVKQVGNRFYVIEVNDNPNIDEGVEDAVLKDKLYQTVVSSFVRRISRKRGQ